MLGEFLRVDLEKGKIDQFKVSERILKKFVGGTGLGAKILYDEVLPGTDCFAPQNRLILAAGPLNATSIGGSGSIAVVSKGPLTNGVGCSQANGYFGAYLRLCGLNGIILQGIASDLQYLYIDSESVELRDANWLAGIDTYQTVDLLKHEHGCREREMAVASIGPAGENLVKFAGIFFDYGHSASHNGLGAVMGSKKLKAVVIKREKQKISIHDFDRLRTLSKEFIENVKIQARTIYDYGTLNILHRNAKKCSIPVKNYTTSTWTIDEDKWKKFSGHYIREKFSIKRNSCWACQIHHCDMMKINEGPYAGEIMEEPEYEQLAAWSSNIGQEDVAAAMMLSKETDRLGMDNNEAGWIVSYVMECYEKNILTKDQTNGLDLSWGNAENTRLLLNLIAKRQGFGNILADGVMRASRKIGGTEFAVYTMKGNTPRGHDHRNRWTELFDTCISNTGTIETRGSPTPFATPKWEDLVADILHDKGDMMFEDSLVTCRFNTRTNVDLLCQALNAVTGWDFSWEECKCVGMRIIHLLRAFNVRHGIIGREIDKPSLRYGSSPDSGPGKGKNLQFVWDDMLDVYYAGMGWDSSGKPLPETLKKYGLDYIINDL